MKKKCPLLHVLFFLTRFDHLNITNEENKPFGMICGQRNGMVINVTGEYVLLTFHSDAELQRGGFMLFFTVFPLPSKWKKYLEVFVALYEKHVH